MIIFIFTVLILFLANSANSASNKTIYKDCKKFSDSGFDEKHPSADNCLIYFAAIRDFGENICFEYKTNLADLDSSEKSVFSFFSIAEYDSIDAAIQDYVNKMKLTPENWKFNAAADVMESLQKIAPCKPE